jgi:hypothetical protein
MRLLKMLEYVLLSYILHHFRLTERNFFEVRYHITPIPVMRLAAGDEVSSLNPANDPNSKKGVSGSRSKCTLSRAIHQHQNQKTELPRSNPLSLCLSS